jgi:hypothetical protein
MSEGFDYQIHRQLNAGSNPDKGLIVTFEPIAEKQPDGSFKNVDYVRIIIGRNDEIVRKVTQEDKVRFADRYSAYKAGEDMPPDGTPIKDCALATPADVSACKAERIFTLEQLAETPDERLQRAKLINFKYKCRDWLESQKRHGYVGELRQQIESLKTQIDGLKAQLAARGETPIEVEPKRKGRPPKVKNGDTATVS